MAEDPDNLSANERAHENERRALAGEAAMAAERDRANANAELADVQYFPVRALPPLMFETDAHVLMQLRDELGDADQCDC